MSTEVLPAPASAALPNTASPASSPLEAYVGDPDARCPSCGAARPERFCGRCGEARIEADDLTLRAFLSHAVEQFTSLDAALWRTVRTLVRHPGQLTADWLEGRRRGTAKPLQLFVLANVLFFVLLSAAGGGFRFRLEQYQHGRLGSVFLGDTTAVQAMVAREAASQGLTVAAYAVRFDAASASQQSVWPMLAPTVAVVLAALYARRRLPFAQHLVFSVHFLAFMLLFLACAMGGVRLVLEGIVALARPIATVAPDAARGLLRGVRLVGSNEALVGYPSLVVLTVWLYRALRRVYPDPWPWAAARTFAVAWVLPRLFDVYRDVLFALTLWRT